MGTSRPGARTTRQPAVREFLTRAQHLHGMPMTQRLVNRFIKKVQNLGVDDVGFFNWRRMGCASDDGFLTAWNGFGQLVRVLAFIKSFSPAMTRVGALIWPRSLSVYCGCVRHIVMTLR